MVDLVTLEYSLVRCHDDAHVGASRGHKEIAAVVTDRELQGVLLRRVAVSLETFPVSEPRTRGRHLNALTVPLPVRPASRPGTSP